MDATRILGIMMTAMLLTGVAGAVEDANSESFDSPVMTDYDAVLTPNERVAPANGRIRRAYRHAVLRRNRRIKRWEDRRDWAVWIWERARDAVRVAHGYAPIGTTIRDSVVIDCECGQQHEHDDENLLAIVCGCGKNHHIRYPWEPVVRDSASLPVECLAYAEDYSRIVGDAHYDIEEGHPDYDYEAWLAEIVSGYPQYADKPEIQAKLILLGNTYALMHQPRQGPKHLPVGFRDSMVYEVTESEIVYTRYRVKAESKADALRRYQTDGVADDEKDWDHHNKPVVSGSAIVRSCRFFGLETVTVGDCTKEWPCTAEFTSHLGPCGEGSQSVDGTWNYHDLCETCGSWWDVQGVTFNENPVLPPTIRDSVSFKRTCPGGTGWLFKDAFDGHGMQIMIPWMDDDYRPIDRAAGDSCDWGVSDDGQGAVSYNYTGPGVYRTYLLNPRQEAAYRDQPKINGKPVIRDSKVAYIEKRFQAKSMTVIDQANVIIEEYDAQGMKLTLRQLYYQFVARGMLDNTQRNYKRLGGIINDGRLAGHIDWDAIEDRTRSLLGMATQSSPAWAIRRAVWSYREDRWENQSVIIEVWIEKEALTGVINRICNEHQVDYFACKGYVSQSELHEAAMRHKRYEGEGKRVVVIHLGDHDPSGMDMTRDIEDRLRTFGAGSEVRRIALSMAQVEEFNPPPNPAKTTDSRSTGYIEEFGESSWELDALDPTTLRDLIRAEIDAERDMEAWRESEAAEAASKAQLEAISDNYREVVQYLEDDGYYDPDDITIRDSIIKGEGVTTSVVDQLGRCFSRAVLNLKKYARFYEGQRYVRCDDCGFDVHIYGEWVYRGGCGPVSSLRTLHLCEDCAEKTGIITIRDSAYHDGLTTTKTDTAVKHTMDVRLSGAEAPIRVEMGSTAGGGFTASGWVNAFPDICKGDEKTVAVTGDCWYGDGDRLPGEVHFGVEHLVVGEKDLSGLKDDVEIAQDAFNAIEEEWEDFDPDDEDTWIQWDGEDCLDADVVKERLLKEHGEAEDELAMAKMALEEEDVEPESDWEYVSVVVSMWGGHSAGGYSDDISCSLEAHDDTDDALNDYDQVMDGIVRVAECIREATFTIYSEQRECVTVCRDSTLTFTLPPRLPNTTDDEWEHFCDVLVDGIEDLLLDVEGSSPEEIAAIREWDWNIIIRDSTEPPTIVRCAVCERPLGFTFEEEGAGSIPNLYCGLADCATDRKATIRDSAMRHGTPIADDGYELGVLKGYTKAELIEEILGTHGWDYLLELDFVKKSHPDTEYDRGGYLIRDSTSVVKAENLHWAFAEWVDENVPEVRPMPSPEQSDLINAYCTHLESWVAGEVVCGPRIAVSACAGSGKTTVLEILLELTMKIDATLSTRASAFNKHIAVTLKEIINNLREQGFTGAKVIGGTNSVQAAGAMLCRDYFKERGIEVGWDADAPIGAKRYRVIARIVLTEHLTLAPDKGRGIISSIAKSEILEKANDRKCFNRLATDLVKIAGVLMQQGYNPFDHGASGKEADTKASIAAMQGIVKPLIGPQGLGDNAVLAVGPVGWLMVHEILWHGIERSMDPTEQSPFSHRFDGQVKDMTEWVIPMPMMGPGRMDAGLSNVRQASSIVNAPYSEVAREIGLYYPPRSNFAKNGGGKVNTQSRKSTHACALIPIEGLEGDLAKYNGKLIVELSKNASWAKIDGVDANKWFWIAGKAPGHVNGKRGHKYPFIDPIMKAMDIKGDWLRIIDDEPNTVAVLEKKYKRLTGGFKRYGGVAESDITAATTGKVILSMDDQTWLPNVLDMEAEDKWDVAMIDEVQDLSPAKANLIFRCVDMERSAIVIVGDFKQAIYLFAGSSSDAMTENQERMVATVYPMTVTWRQGHHPAESCRAMCADAVKYAQAVWGKVEFPDYNDHHTPSFDGWRMGAKEITIDYNQIVDAVEHILQSPDITLTEADKQFTVLSYLNGPLAPVIKQLVMAGIPVSTPSGEGGIVSAVSKLLKMPFREVLRAKNHRQGVSFPHKGKRGLEGDTQMAANDDAVFDRLLQIDEDEWEQAVRRANGDSNLAGKDETYTEISSTVEIAETLMEMWFKHQAETGDTTRTVEAFRDYCKTVLFSAEGEGVHVSSVHRYKGDQDAVTFLLRGVPATDKEGKPTVMDPFMRSFVVEQSPESAIEQCNVVYVAASRSKDMNIRVTVLGEDAEPVGPAIDRAFGIIRDSTGNGKMVEYRGEVVEQLSERWHELEEERRQEWADRQNEKIGGITPTQASALRRVRSGDVQYIGSSWPEGGRYKPSRLYPKSAMHKNTLSSLWSRRLIYVDLLDILRLTEVGEEMLNAHKGRIIRDSAEWTFGFCSDCDCPHYAHPEIFPCGIIRDSRTIVTESGHIVDYDDGSISVQFAHGSVKQFFSLEEYAPDADSMGLCITMSHLSGDWCGGDEETPDEFCFCDIAISKDGRWLEDYDPNTHEEVSVTIADCEYYDGVQLEHGNGDDLKALPTDLCDALVEAVNCMIADWEDITDEAMPSRSEVFATIRDSVLSDKAQTTIDALKTTLDQWGFPRYIIKEEIRNMEIPIACPDCGGSGYGISNPIFMPIEDRPQDVAWTHSDDWEENEHGRLMSYRDEWFRVAPRIVNAERLYDEILASNIEVLNEDGIEPKKLWVDGDPGVTEEEAAKNREEGYSYTDKEAREPMPPGWVALGYEATIATGRTYGSRNKTWWADPDAVWVSSVTCNSCRSTRPSRRSRWSMGGEYRAMGYHMERHDVLCDVHYPAWPHGTKFDSRFHRYDCEICGKNGIKSGAFPVLAVREDGSTEGMFVGNDCVKKMGHTKFKSVKQLMIKNNSYGQGITILKTKPQIYVRSYETQDESEHTIRDSMMTPPRKLKTGRKGEAMTPLTDDPKMALAIHGMDAVIPILNIRGNPFKARKLTDWCIRWNSEDEVIEVFSESRPSDHTYPLVKSAWGYKQRFDNPVHRLKSTAWFPCGESVVINVGTGEQVIRDSLDAGVDAGDGEHAMNRRLWNAFVFVQDIADRLDDEGLMERFADFVQGGGQSSPSVTVTFTGEVAWDKELDEQEVIRDSAQECLTCGSWLMLSRYDYCDSRCENCDEFPDDQFIRDSAQYVSISLDEMDAFLVDAQGFTRVDPSTYGERHIGDFCRECVYEYPLSWNPFRLIGEKHAQNASIRVYSSIPLPNPPSPIGIHRITASRGKGRDAIRCLVVNEEGWPIEKFTRTHRVKNWRLNLLRKYEPSIKDESTVIRDSIEYEVITDPPHQGFVSTEQQLSCFQGFLETDYATLVERFGEPLTDSYDGKIQAEWVIRTGGRIATIYDYKEYDTPVEEITEWHIGGFNPIVAPLVREIVQGVDNAPSLPRDSMTSSRVLYRWQEEALAVIREAIGSDDPNTTVAAVTGAGKTEVAVRLIDEWDGLVTIVVPRKALMTQWRDDLEPQHHPYRSIGRVGGGSIKGWPNKPSNHGGPIKINIVTINAMRDGKVAEILMEEAALWPRLRHLIIVDECHNLRGEKNRHALNNIAYDAVVGLSATPHPTEDAKTIVEALCGPIRYSYRYGQALADGVIPPFVLHAVQVPLKADEKAELRVLDEKIKSAMRRAREVGGGPMEREMIQIAKQLGMRRKRLLNDAESRYLLASNLLHDSPDVPTMVFHDTIEGVERLAEMTSDLNPAVYHSKSKQGNNEIQRFLTGETQHLYSCLALAEGFNAPRVERAIMMSGPNAPLRRIQTLGRCLRGRTDTPNEIYFFYVAGTKDEMGLHNLLKTADIPATIEVKEVTIDVVKHWRTGVPFAFLTAIEAPKEPEAFKARIPQKCEKCGRGFKSEVGLNSHHCVDRSWMGENPPETLDELIASLRKPRSPSEIFGEDI